MGKAFPCAPLPMCTHLNGHHFHRRLDSLGQGIYPVLTGDTEDWQMSVFQLLEGRGGTSESIKPWGLLLLLLPSPSMSLRRLS